MEIKFNVTGERRKALVKTVSEVVGINANYKGAPSFKYEVGGFIIDKDGTLSFNNQQIDADCIQALLNKLNEQGFYFEMQDRLTIEFPKDSFTESAIANLEKLISSKAALIKKAIGTDDLIIKKTETTLCFPWFSSDISSDEVNAYARFIGALCTAAKKYKYVSSTEKQVDNEKYAFRCFLLRLGFIGNDYKNERKVLLSKLAGNSSWKSK